MSISVYEPLPPDMLEGDREPLSPSAATALPLAELGAVASTLLIPLAARACGDAIFPRVAVGDALAARTLAALGPAAAAAASTYLADCASVYAVLARTGILRARARNFFERQPRSIGVGLGAGLGSYFQWLDRGSNRWLDADLPAVTALRERLLPRTDDRRLNVAVDLTVPGWWQRLGLPAGRHEPPVLLMCEGVLMYLEPAQVQAVLREVGEQAPPGSRLLLDAVHRLAVGRARHHPSVRLTGAEFRWGLGYRDELAAAHPRLRVDGWHAVMDGCGPAWSLAGPAFRFAFGVPLYAVVELGLDA